MHEGVSIKKSDSRTSISKSPACGRVKKELFDTPHTLIENGRSCICMKLTLQLYTRFFEEKQSLMNETYFGEEGADSIVLEDLEIEGWKRNSFTHNTF